MVRFVSVTVAALMAAVAVAPAADLPPDTAAAHFTRTKKLKGKVTVEIKNEPLSTAFETLSEPLVDQKLGPISVQYGVGVSKNTRVTYSGKDVTIEEALDGILKQLDLGYEVVSSKDRYDGWIKLSKGTHRGYPAGVVAPKPDPATAPKPEPKTEPKTEPKPEPKTEPKPKPAGDPNDPDEKQARLRLDLAKECLANGKPADAARLFKYILAKYPKTAAAAEAKELADKNK